MKPEIRQYIDDHRATYTPEALRRGLAEAGYEPAEIDAAFDEWASEQTVAGGDADAQDRRAFGRWALGLHVGALAVMIVTAILMNGTQNAGLVLIGAVVLAVMLLIGWAISAVIGRALLPRTGLQVALILPAISAIGLGGTCIAITDGLTPTPPTPGSVELHLDAPLAFDASGAAECLLQSDGTGFSINAFNLGTIDGGTVGIQILAYGISGGAVPAPASGQTSDSTMSLYLSVASESDAGPSLSYTNTVDSALRLDAAADRTSGTVTFEGLAPEQEPGTDAVSGSAEWTCE